MSDIGKVAVLMGGPSAEREVSLKSGAAVLAALQRRGVEAEGIDADRDIIERLVRGGYARAFIALHGRWGEDGVIQGALEVIGMPYTGSGVMASALGMDKLRCKQLWKGAGVATPAYEVLTGDSDFGRVVKRLGLPLFVKPAREGSSFGISKVTDGSQLEAAWTAAAKYDDVVIAERGVVGQELTIAILGEQALPVIRLQPAREFYDYEAKYILDTTVYHCPSGLSPTDERRVQRLALAAFAAVGCQGWGRVDIMRDGDGRAHVLEINTVPGMTDHSLVPKAAAAAGIDFDELVMRILRTSEVRR